MRRLMGWSLPLACLAALVAACFGDALFRHQQFGYRDAAHFYYPLYQRVQQVWQQGRLPVWDARENAGMPLLGNPTAAVLYPVKLVFAIMPYPWAARVYIVVHFLIAVGGMILLMRNWGVSRTGAAIAGLSFAFGAPILFQYCNVIYLVGAAWVPWGLRAADRWVRQGRRWAIVELALILSMQVLGGDPQAAYLVGLGAAGYAVGLSASKSARENRWRITGPKVAIGLVAIIATWVAMSLLAAYVLPRFRAKTLPPPPFFWSRWVSTVVLAVWVVVAVVMCWRWRNFPRPGAIFPRMIAGLIVSAGLAGTVSAAQLLPVIEFTQKTERASEDGTHDIFPFSLEIPRLAEFVWPGVYGMNTRGNRAWLAVIPPRHRIEFWVPSLYIGGLALILAMAGAGFRDPRRAWLTTILIVSLLACFGKFGSPLWLARNIPAVAARIGPLDALDTGPIRRDWKLRDGEGGFYWLLATALPGFGSFRYPSKLLTFTVVALAGLSGFGWDDATRRKSRRAGRIAACLFFASMVGVGLAQFGRAAILKVFEKHAAEGRSNSFGPFDTHGAWKETRDAFLIGSVVYGASALLLAGVRRSRSVRRASGPVALAIVTADLIFANSWLVYTVPQSFFEDKPEVLQKIEEAEARDPSPGPYRIHRMPSWEPPIWSQASSTDRLQDLVRWERKTIQPKYGLPLGVSYTYVMGVGELYDLDWFFSPFHGNLIDPKGPRNEANKVVYFPRRGFDLWNTRYFVIPAMNRNDETHAISAFLIDIKAIAPRPDQMDGPENKASQDAWVIDQDWRVVRNRRAYPRAWIVHDVEIHPPVMGLRGNEERKQLMYKLLYQADQYWTMTGWKVHDPRRVAILEVDWDEASLQLQSVSGRDPDPRDKCEVRPIDDETVRIDVDLTSPGLVVLADVFYPGWEATIDAVSTPIFRTNRLMRGVAVPSGPHTIMFRYRSRTVATGIAVSCLGIIFLVGAGAWSSRQGRRGSEPAVD